MQKRKFIFTLALLVLAATADFGCDQGGADPVPPFGVLDTSFNGTGYVTHGNAALWGQGDDHGNALAIDSLGRILVTGYSSDYYITDFPPPSPTHSAMVIWRFNPEGTLDPTFNGSGFVTQSGAAGGYGNDGGSDIAIDSDDGILVAGASINASGNFDMTIWRYRQDGSLDTTFNGTGFAAHDSAAGGNGNDIGVAIKIDSTRRIIVAGNSTDGNGASHMTIWRFNQSGSLDSTFNGKGYVTFNDAAGNDNWAADAVLDSSGRIVVAGHSSNPDGDSMMIWRFNQDGTLDTTLNGSGYVMSDPGSGGYYAWITSIALDVSERILVTGEGRAGVDSGMMLIRLNADGSLDTTFNGTGYVVNHALPEGNIAYRGEDITLDGSGRILVAGCTYNVNSHNDLALWRFNSNGSIDTTFNGGGFVTFDGLKGEDYDGDFGEAILLDASERILVAGSTYRYGALDLAMWRYK